MRFKAKRNFIATVLLLIILSVVSILGIKNGDIINIPDYENIVEVLKID